MHACPACSIMWHAVPAVLQGGRGVSELELRNMSKLIQSLPQYRWAG